MPDDGGQLVDRRAVRDLQRAHPAPSGTTRTAHASRPPAARLQRRAVLGDDVRRQVRDAVREHRPDEVDRLPTGSAQRDPLDHAHMMPRESL